MLKLIKVEVKDAKKLLDVQRICFYEYLEKYHDYSINPANKTPEQLEKTISDESYFAYFIEYNQELAGMICIKKISEEKCEIDIFGILPDYRNKHLGNKVINMIFEIHNTARIWVLGTMLQEEKNIYFYEKIGFSRIPDAKPIEINEYLTIVRYQLIR